VSQESKFFEPVFELDATHICENLEKFAFPPNARRLQEM